MAIEAEAPTSEPMTAAIVVTTVESILIHYPALPGRNFESRKQPLSRPNRAAAEAVTLLSVRRGQVVLHRCAIRNRQTAKELAEKETKPPIKDQFDFIMTGSSLPLIRFATAVQRVVHS